MRRFGSTAMMGHGLAAVHEGTPLAVKRGALGLFPFQLSAGPAGICVEASARVPPKVCGQAPPTGTFVVQAPVGTEARLVAGEVSWSPGWERSMAAKNEE